MQPEPVLIRLVNCTVKVIHRNYSTYTTVIQNTGHKQKPIFFPKNFYSYQAKHFLCELKKEHYHMAPFFFEAH